MKYGDITTGHFRDEKVLVEGENTHIRFYFTAENYIETYVQDNVLHVRVMDGSMNIKPVASNCIEIKHARLFDK